MEILRHDIVRIASVTHQMKYTDILSDNRRRDEARDALDWVKDIFAAGEDIVDLLGASKLWDMNITGEGIRVALFDTGVDLTRHNYFGVRECVDWTYEGDCGDFLGHGTFMSGLISSLNERCRGLAPGAQVFSFKVFTRSRISYTSWFLDAFNYAIHRKIHVLNLSLGGRDYLDLPFVEKVREMAANNMVVVSAIGNDGPWYGTLNNPGDLLEVIGVGGIGSQRRLSAFSSRGMTLLESTYGAGRVKPDVVTFGEGIVGLSTRGRCGVLSGTSTSSSIASGVIALLLSSVKDEVQRIRISNVAAMKQILIAGAEKLPVYNIFEQGHGRIDLLSSFELLRSSFEPAISFSPGNLDLTDCPYMWPHCVQPMYHGAMDVAFNISVINSIGAIGVVIEVPEWRPTRFPECLHLSFAYPEHLWPWVSWMGVYMRVSSAAAEFSGICTGNVVIRVRSSSSVYEASLPVRVRVIPTPSRERRILWDQFHNLQFPADYFPSDDISSLENDGANGAMFDWNGDHPHTNFKFFFENLVSWGYYVEVLTTPFACFDASSYGILLIVDPEEEFFLAELDKLEADVRRRGLSLMIFADWYNERVTREFEFYDRDSRRLWTPVLGGCNIPALNDLLRRFRIQLGDGVYYGEVPFYDGGHNIFRFAYGTSIIRFPPDGWLLEAANLRNYHTDIPGPVPIMGLYDTGTGGKISILGDSTCLEMSLSSNVIRNCSLIAKAMAEFCSSGKLPGFVHENDRTELHADPTGPDIPQRVLGSNLFKSSKVLNKRMDCGRTHFKVNQSPCAAAEVSNSLFIEACHSTMSLERGTGKNTRIGAALFLTVATLAIIFVSLRGTLIDRSIRRFAHRTRIDEGTRSRGDVCRGGFLIVPQDLVDDHFRERGRELRLLFDEE